jgi:hypothetical protein
MQKVHCLNEGTPVLSTLTEKGITVLGDFAGILR